jgi:hypothetical protein
MRQLPYKWPIRNVISSQEKNKKSYGFKKSPATVPPAPSHCPLHKYKATMVLVKNLQGYVMFYLIYCKQSLIQNVDITSEQTF